MWEKFSRNCYNSYCFDDISYNYNDDKKKRKLCKRLLIINCKIMITMIMIILLSRRVYNRATAPRLGVLAPEFDDEGGLVLSYVDLPFAEDRRELQFAPLIDPRCWFIQGV